MKIIMLGAPGAGKGTQAKKIAAKYQIPHISTGDIFRANIKNGTELGKKAKTYMDQGLLVPDELTCDLVVDRIQQPDAANGYVLDGFPRTIPQAECLTEALNKLGSKLVLRDDDQPETVQKRLNVYHEQTQPLIDYYTKEGILKSVDGTKDLEEVFADIVAILGE